MLHFSSLRWTFNDGPLPPNAVVYDLSSTASLLMLYTIDDTNAGAFTCVANNSATGMIIVDTAYITVSGIGVI